MCLAFTDRHCEPAAYNVTQYVIGYEVQILISPFLLQEVDGSNDTAPCTAYTWFRSAALDVNNVAKTGLQHIFEFQILY
ncbi:hypothetical protein D3C81_1788410 [compost metagenome]